MRITICGSSTFRKEKDELKTKLEKLGIKVYLDQYTIKLAQGKLKNFLKQVQKDHASIKQRYSLIQTYFQEIKNSDAILIANYTKNNIKNYIGANTFLEMGFAFVLNKKIFLLNNIPDQKYISDEIKVFSPIILKNNLTKILWPKSKSYSKASPMLIQK